MKSWASEPGLTVKKDRGLWGRDCHNSPPNSSVTGPPVLCRTQTMIVLKTTPVQLRDSQ